MLLQGHSQSNFEGQFQGDYNPRKIPGTPKPSLAGDAPNLVWHWHLRGWPSSQICELKALERCSRQDEVPFICCTKIAHSFVNDCEQCGLIFGVPGNPKHKIIFMRIQSANVTRNDFIRVPLERLTCAFTLDCS